MFTVEILGDVILAVLYMFTIEILGDMILAVVYVYYRGSGRCAAHHNHHKERSNSCWHCCLL